MNNIKWLDWLIDKADNAYDVVGEVTAIPIPGFVANLLKDKEGIAPTHFSPISVDFYYEQSNDSNISE